MSVYMRRWTVEADEKPRAIMLAGLLYIMTSKIIKCKNIKLRKQFLIFVQIIRATDINTVSAPLS